MFVSYSFLVISSDTDLIRVCFNGPKTCHEVLDVGSDIKTDFIRFVTSLEVRKLRLATTETQHEQLVRRDR